MGAPVFQKPTCILCHKEIHDKMKVMFIEGRVAQQWSHRPDILSMYRIGNHGKISHIICLECWNTEIGPRLP